MAIRIDGHELERRTAFQDSITLVEICEHINGFGESDYKHIADGVIKILKENGLIEEKI